MGYVLKLSLERMSVLRIAITLWNQNDIQLLIISGRDWKTIADKVTEKVPKLLLPKSLERKVADFVEPVGLEILRWKEYHEEILSQKKIVEKNLNKLCWTPQGTVDRKKTAEVLIKEESLNIVKRYKLACIYCLENDIPELWNQVPKNCEIVKYNEFSGNVYQNNFSGDVHQSNLILFWTYDVNGEVDRLADLIEKSGDKCSSYQYGFEYAATHANKVAVEYFMRKLTLEEREKCFVRVAKSIIYQYRKLFTERQLLLCKEYYADVICFLFSQMNDEQQIKVFKMYPREVLKSFLEWPWQTLFMEIANRMWCFLRRQSYYYLLCYINNKAMTEYTDYDYRKLFGEFWQHSPMSRKEYVIDRYEGCPLFSDLFTVGDSENIKLIFKDATLEQRNELIFSSKGQDICQYLIFHDKWDLLEFFIEECISSKQKMIEFKKEFEYRRCSKEKLAEAKEKCDKFFQLLDKFIQRKCVEQDDPPAKRKKNETH